MSRASPRILRNTLVVMAGTLASRVLGLVRQQFFVNLFPDALKDAFTVAYRVPNLFREILAEGAVQNALIPIIKGLSEAEARVFLRRFGALLLGLNLLFIGLGWLLAPWIAHLLIDRSSYLNQPEQFAQVVYLIRLVMPFLLGISMGALFTAVLQAEERFGASSFAPIMFNLGSIALFVLWPGNPTALGLSAAVGGLLQALVQLPYLRGFWLEWKPHRAFGEALRRMGPFTFTTGLRQILNLVLVNVLTRYPAGATNAFYNAEVIYLMVLGLLSTSPAMALYPRMADQQNDPVALGNLLRRALERVVVLMGLAGGLLVALAPWLVGALYAFSANFTPENRFYSSQTLTAMGFAVLPWGINTFLLRGFYALGEVARAVQVSVVILVLNALGYWLLRDTGLFALNLSTAVAGLVGLLIYAARLERLQVLSLRWLLEFSGRVVLAALPSAAVAYGVARWFGFPGYFLHNLPPLIAGGLMGLAAFFVAARWLKLPLRLR
ncbi:murein biosynthesis integral membrane protein MurJ [Meiothermus granaticius NBRC 107808]|uniref:Putative lipid II flippase MurJ n=1 Tax=Meiothermus granaticius NBRC 107808 TaxID=1227551 RepID=A0A399F604_9DEIN|nr:putative lipid II flippase MurJ [Meiothermus granaticius NBRC 107808]GEM85635.1 murein biosynthesis integral membrane protein MurJ [Meiothermus granaticius NBRC 107808]